MKYIPKLIGNRLYLSPLNVDDASILTKWLNDKTISENIGVDNMVITLENEKEWLKHNQNDYNFGIVLKEGDELIGCCGFSHVDLVHRNASVIIFIGNETLRGMGYGKEALKLLLEYGFNSLNFNNIMLKVYSFDVNALKLYEKVGFKKFGIRRQAYYLKGKFYDEIYMEILRDEYKEIEPYIYI